MASDINLRLRAGAKGSLVSFCSARRDEAQQHFNAKYKKDWVEFRALWETRYSGDNKKGGSRCKLVSPYAMMAVDTASADMDAAIGFDNFFEVEPDVPEEARQQWSQLYGQAFDDVARAAQESLAGHDSNARREISEAVFNAALYGLGWLKVVSTRDTRRVLAPGGVETVESVRTTLQSVDPFNVWVDPSAASIDEAEYVVEETIVADKHVRDMIDTGIYNAVKLQALEPNKGTGRKLYEYHGLVPKSLLIKSAQVPGDGFDDLLAQEAEEAEGLMVEAVVIWEDGCDKPLYAEENPFWDGEKSYIPFPWDTVPGQIAGRGVVAKIRSTQKAYDANMRARIDALGFAVAPMVGVNVAMLASSRKPVVAPGRQVLFNGDPNQAMTSLRIGDVPQSAFLQGQELASLADAATGITAAGGVDPKYQSAEGIGMLQQPGINRQRRTLESVTAFLKRAIRLFLWRSTQFDTTGSFPAVCPDFRVTVTVGSLTRRQEQAQVAAMLKTIPQESPAYWKLLVQYFKLSDIPDKNEIVADVEQLAQAVLNPPEQGPTFEQQLALQQLQLQAQQAEVSQRLQAYRVQAELVRAAAALERNDAEEVKAVTAAILNIAKAESEEAGIQVGQYKAIVDSLKVAQGGTGGQYKREAVTPIAGADPVATVEGSYGGGGGDEGESG